MNYIEVLSKLSARGGWRVDWTGEGLVREQAPFIQVQIDGEEEGRLP